MIFTQANTLVVQHEIDEAREIRDEALATASRVLGPDHHLTQWLADPDFLEPPPAPETESDSMSGSETDETSESETDSDLEIDTESDPWSKIREFQ